MDPVSIIASAIAIATPITISLRKIREARHAKLDLSVLEEEVADIVRLLHELSEALRIQRSSSTLRPDAQLFQTLEATNKKLEELSKHISEWSSRTSTPTNGMKVRPLAWAAISSKVRTFRNELQTLRFQLITMLSMGNLSRTTRIELSLQDVMLLTRDLSRDHLQAQSEFRDDLSRKHNEIETLLNVLADRVSNTKNTTSHTTTIDNIEVSQITAPQTEETTSIKAFHHNGSILFDSAQVTAVSAVGIRAVQFPRTSCRPWCSCRCHREYKFRTPRFLDQFIGSLYIGHSGLPVLRTPCNERSCHLASQPVTYMKYFFPNWFLSRMVSFMMTITPMAGPVASLKVQRTVPGSSEIFNFAKVGDVDGIKALFEKGLASPHDVQFDSGITPLHMAINHAKVSVCKFLLQTNADPFLSDFVQCTAADSAWTKILSQSLEAEAEQAMRSMFSETECIERRGFTVLHKIVLGLLNRDLVEELRTSTAELNEKDSIGRTPLSMAAERSNDEHLSILLDFGANPELACHSEHTSLHCAASAKEPLCMQLLLQAGAKVDCLSNWQQTPLHFAAAYVKDVRHANLLLDAGADPNRRDRDGMTPLHWTAISNNIEIASVLLTQSGIVTEDLDLNGSSTLKQCIKLNRHQILGFLSRKAPRVLHCFPVHEVILDFIQQYADSETLRLLKSFDFTGVPVTDDCMESNETCQSPTLSDSIQSLSESTALFRDLVLHVITGEVDSDLLESDVEVWEDAMDSM